MLTATAKATITPAAHDMVLKYTLTPRLGMPEDIASTLAHTPFRSKTALIGPAKHGNA